MRKSFIFFLFLCIAWKQIGEIANSFENISDILLNQPSKFKFSLLKACVLYILRVGVIDQMMESSQRSFSVFLGKQVLLFIWTALCPCKSELQILKNLIYIFTSWSSKLCFFFSWNKCSFSLQMLVHQWKLLLCGLWHTRWKHWERWGCYRGQTLLICCLKVLFSLI